MANDLNQCNFIGRLGRDPETRFSADGKAICNFSIGVSSSWAAKDGSGKQESTEWVRVSAFGKLAEICGEYLKKGSQVFVCGKMKTRKWSDKEGQDKYTTEIIADQMQMLGGPKSEAKPAEKVTAKPPSFDDMSDDIPFN